MLWFIGIGIGFAVIIQALCCDFISFSCTVVWVSYYLLFPFRRLGLISLFCRFRLGCALIRFLPFVESARLLYAHVNLFV